MKYQVSSVGEGEYAKVVAVWESSVRATHHFLKEEDIQFYKVLILNEYLNAVELACVRDGNGVIVGFLGVAEDRIEMLFIDPITIGKGVGKLLLNHARYQLNATKVDVNEANEQAVGFYQHAGFSIVSRSELDPAGKPFPILHMELAEL